MTQQQSPPTGAGYVTVDKRRFSNDGERRKRPNSHLPHIDSRSFQKPMEGARDAILRRLEDGVPPPYWPRQQRAVDIVRGLLISLDQVQHAVLAVVADKRSDILVFPAGVLCRASVEGLANLMAVLEHPLVAPRRLGEDDYRHTRRIIDGKEMQVPHLKQAIAREHRILRGAASFLKLSSEQVKEPEKYCREFPSPGTILGRSRKKDRELELSGSRKEAMLAIYDFWYAGLSAYAHQRMRALQVAVSCFDVAPEDEDDADIGRTNAVSLATMAVLCALTEVDAHLSNGQSSCLHLAAAWGQVRPMNRMTERVYEMRYRQLLPIGPEINPPKAASQPTPKGSRRY